MTTATIEGNVPHVYTAVAAILKSLSVEKGGTLPSNMGGKPYITAVDVSAEVKRQFVANDLVYFPSETVVKHEIVPFKDRLNIAVVIEGSYRIVSTRDGSSEVISGTGDGLATGTAVASNIASTNALKNAMLRFFLITEQSVEDAAKNGSEDAAPATSKPLAKARTATQPTPPPGLTNSASKDKIRVNYVEAGKITKDEVNTAYKAYTSSGKNGAQAFDAVLADLESGKLVGR